jgi:hypothetical protein
LAVWQFKVALLPQQWIEAGGDVRSLFGEEGFESAVAWRGIRKDQLQERLGALLPLGQSWHSDLVLWGRTESDDIQLWLKGSQVESVQVRFDLRQPNIGLFRNLANVSRQLGAVIFGLESKTLLAADAHELLRAAAESKAAHFVIDPESFLLDAVAANDRAT